MLFNRLPLITALCLCVAIIGGLYLQLAPILLSNKKDSPSATASTLVKAPTPISQTKKLHDISKFQLFGDAKKVIKETKPVVKDLPKTSLKLVLTGVMASQSTEIASALIQGPDKNTDSYRISDELPGGAILKHVYPDRVVIERSGRLENLIFVEKRPIGIESYEPPEDDEQETAKNITPANLPAATSIPSNPGRTQGIKDRLSKLRKRMLKNRSVK